MSAVANLEGRLAETALALAADIHTRDDATTSSDYEDWLADVAIRLAQDARSEPALARTRLKELSPLEQQQIACVLAAFLPLPHAPRGTLRQLVHNIRHDVPAAHRTVAGMSKRGRLEDLCLMLAAVVPDDRPWLELAWWRTLAPAVRKGSVAA